MSIGVSGDNAGDATYPHAYLIFNAARSLFGMTIDGGAHSCTTTLGTRF